jgi:hypothetical protein
MGLLEKVRCDDGKHNSFKGTSTLGRWYQGYDLGSPATVADGTIFSWQIWFVTDCSELAPVSF